MIIKKLIGKRYNQNPESMYSYCFGHTAKMILRPCTNRLHVFVDHHVYPRCLIKGYVVRSLLYELYIELWSKTEKRNTWQSITVHHEIIQYSADQYNKPQNNSIHYRTMQYNTDKCNLLQNNEVHEKQYSSQHYNISYYRTIQ